MSWPGRGLAEWMRCLAGSLSSWLARHQDCSAQQLAGQTDGWQASQYVSQTACQLAMQPSSQLPSQPTSHGPGWQAGISCNVSASTLRQIITKMRFPRRGINLVLGSCPEGDKFALIASEGSDIHKYTDAGRLWHRSITGWQQLSYNGGHAIAWMLVVSDGEAPKTF